MANCPNCDDSGSGRTLYPALAVAALAGVAFTYFLVRKSKTGDEQMPVEKVVNICNTAADKLDALAGKVLAG